MGSPSVECKEIRTVLVCHTEEQATTHLTLFLSSQLWVLFLPYPLDQRETNILDLVEFANLLDLDPWSDEAYRRLWRQAKRQFLVTDKTATDYAKLAIQILRDPLRTELELTRLRIRRINRK